MKYFKNKENKIYAYDDDVSQDILNEFIVKHNLTPLNKKELNELNEPSLNELKELKKAEILSAFNRNLENLDGGLSIEPLGIVVDCGRIHAENVASMITLLANTSQDNITFRLYDNTSRLTSLAELKAIQTAIIAEGFKQYEKKWALEQAINEATSKEQIEAIKW
ncbi:DUF4376 domain-containing protein [Campylobacter suis]|uniref:DUF4376 domain-containing protein n=1 Tax=Campylobacter suis TaxID=2790657 RepID=A0ABM8Q5P6_9BACT|nr:DUF4376 domain-containing protein [Campylobacter suis]CAD7288204.1 hypothetical protein LMG8286_01189 [Campylobacter suis]